MSDLKPKPCCGPKPPRPWWQYLDLMPIKSWILKCDHCGRETQWRYSRTEVIELWNNDDLYRKGKNLPSR